MKIIVLLVIRMYQRLISIHLGNNCRFDPSCSSYAHDAIDRYGVVRGAILATRRVIRCHPWDSGGFDPVP